MRRFIGILLCIVLAATVLSTGGVAATDGFPIGTVNQFKLYGVDASIQTVTSTERSPVAVLNRLLSTAADERRKPADAKELARLEVQTDDRTYLLTIEKSGERYLLCLGNQSREVSYSSINNWINTIGSDKVYPYRAVPNVNISGSGAQSVSIAPDSGNYSYRRLSGSFNAVSVPVGAKEKVLPYQDGKLYRPTFVVQPEEVSLRVEALRGDYTWAGGLSQLESYRLPEAAEYRVYIQASYNNEFLRGNLRYSYQIKPGNADDGQIRFHVEGGDTYLGEVVVLKVTGTTESDPIATFTSDISLNLPPRFYREADGSQIALFPVSYRNTAGNHWIEIALGSQKQRFVLDAKNKQWQIQNLVVSGETVQGTIQSNTANEEYERLIAPLRPIMDDTRHWNGRFIIPVNDQKITTQFGMIRHINGSPTSERHGAVDYAVPKGTPVKATGSGRILYAGYLQLTGNTVLIEHGFGLKSWYYHMNTLNVQTGAMVKQGDIIGTVGSTGFSTGPHLHFGMSINNVFINPYTLINTDLLVD